MTAARNFVRFEQPRVAAEFRAFADGLATAEGVKPDVGAALKAAINDAVQRGRVRRSDPRRSYFDLEADGCADEVELARMKADREKAK